MPQRTNNNSIEDLVESEGNVSLVANPSRMMKRMSNEIKEGIKKEFREELEEIIQKLLKEYKENIDKKLERTQK
jgi:DNA-binding cell septation regulator SpoVG